MKRIMAGRIIEAGLDPKLFMLGDGETYAEDEGMYRFMFRVDGRKDMRKTNGTFKYALKYFRKHALCVLWRVPKDCVGRQTARWRFRAPAKRIIDLKTEEIKPDRLFLWGKDVRYCVIPFRRLPEFLERYREELR